MEDKKNEYENMENIENEEKDVSIFAKTIDFIVEVTNSIINISIALFGFFMILYKFVVRHTLLISVILVILGYVLLVN